MNALDPAARKHKILSLIVERYIRSGEPVGSKSLSADAALGVSSATVRNDMAELTEKGYLAQPHTSAGRVPTERGYRYYVDNAMQLTPVSEQGRDLIRDALSKGADSPEGILQCAADILSRLTDCVALAASPGGEGARIRRISFVPTGAHAGMAVVIASSGVISTRLFRCEFLLTPEILQVFDKALNETFAGIPLISVTRPFVQTAAAGFGELSLFMTSPLMAVMEACSQAAQTSVYHSGYGRLMNAAQTGFGSTYRLWEFLQNRHDVAAMLEKLPQTSSVTIGSENSRTELSHGAVASVRYTVDDAVTGVLAVIGPLRMDYARTLSVLNCVSEYVGELIGELIEDNT